MTTITLNADESRVLGVLIEKAQTTPGQYPLTLNALVNGCNQLSNREPVMHLDEERVLDALDGLKKKALAREVMLEGSRVAKFRHVSRDVLSVTTEQLVILAELLLRGPQSAGSLRGNATRMAPIESMESCQALLESLADRKAADGTPLPPLVKNVPPPPGTRATLWAQLLAPDLHPVSFKRDAAGGGVAAMVEGVAAGGGLAARVEELEKDVKELRAAISKLASRVGETDPFLG